MSLGGFLPPAVVEFLGDLTDVDSNIRRLEQRLASLSRADSAAERSASRSVSGPSASGGDSGLRDVEQQAQRTDRSMGTLSRSVLGAAGNLARLGSVGAGAAGLLAGGIQTAAGLAQSIAAIGPAALLAAPAVLTLAGAVASIKLGFAGVGGALKAYTKQQDKAASGAGSSAAAARAAASAIANANDTLISARERLADVYASSERRIRDSQRDALRAQKDLTEARIDAGKRIDDLRRKVERASLSEEDASLRVAEAEAALHDTQRRGKSTALERQRAALSLREAELALQDTQRENAENAAAYADAAARGVEGSDQVIDAQERVRDTAEQAALAQQDAVKDIASAQRALAAAERQMADAQAAAAEKAGGGGVDEFAQKMAKLPPLTQQFVRDLIGMKHYADEFKISASEMLPGLMDGLKSLATNAPVVNAGIKATALSIGEVGRKAGEAFSGPAFSAQLGRIMDANAEATLGFGSAGINLGKSLFTVADAARDVWVELSQSAEAGSKNLSSWLAQKQASGELEAAIRKGLQTVREFGRGFRDIFVGLRSLIGAIRGDMDSSSANFAAGAAAFRAWATSADTVGKVSAVFRTFQEIIGVAGDGVSEFVSAFRSGQSDASGFAGIMGEVGIKAKSLWVLFSQHLWPLLVDIGRVFLAAAGPARAFGDAAGESGFEGLGKGLDTLREQLAPFFANLIQFFEQIKPMGSAMGKVFAEIIVPALVILAQIVGAVLIPVLNVFAAVLANVVAPALGWFGGVTTEHTHSVGLLVAAFMLFSRVIAPIMGTRAALRGLITGLRTARELWQVSRLLSLATAFRTIGMTILRLTPGIRTLLQLGNVLRGIVRLPGLIRSGIMGIRMAMTAFSAFMASNPLGLLLLGLGLLIAAFIIAYHKSETFRNFVHAALDAVGRAFQWVVNFLGDLPAKIGAFFEGAGRWLYDAGSKILGGLLEGIKFYAGFLYWFYIELPLKILGFFVDAGRWLYDAGARILGGLRDGIWWIWGQTAAWIGRIGGWVGDMFSGAGRWLYDAGSKILSGLWDGMKDKWESVKGWVGGIGGKIISLKGPPEYDARMLTPAGTAIMQSLQVGMARAWPQVAQYLSGVTGQITAGPGAGWAGAASSWGGAAPAATGGASRPPDIVVQIDGREVFRAVQTQSLQSERRNLTNGLSAAGTGGRPSLST